MPQEESCRGHCRWKASEPQTIGSPWRFLSAFFIGDSDDGFCNNEADEVPLITIIDIIDTDATECPDKAVSSGNSCPFGRPEELSLEAAIGGIYNSSGQLEGFSLEAAIGGNYNSFGRTEDFSQEAAIGGIYDDNDAGECPTEGRWLLKPPPIRKILIIP